MSQLPLIPFAQATNPVTQVADVAEGSLTAEPVEQLVNISFEEAMQEVLDTLEDCDHPGLGWIAAIPMEPMHKMQNGSLMPDQAAATGKSMPLQFGEAPLLQAELIRPVVLAEPNNGLLTETMMGKTDRTAVAAVLSTTHDGMLKTFDSRSADELTSQAPLMGVQPFTSTQPGRSGMLTLPVDIPVAQPGWDKAVGERIQWMIGRNIQNAEIKLTPPNLGPMEIRISVQNDQASVSFIAAQAPTREALEAAIPRLREMLGEANLNLTDADVGQHHGSDAHQGQLPGDGGHGYSGRHETATPDTTITTHTRHVSDGLLDDYA